MKVLCTGDSEAENHRYRALLSGLFSSRGLLTTKKVRSVLRTTKKVF